MTKRTAGENAAAEGVRGKCKRAVRFRTARSMGSGFDCNPGQDCVGGRGFVPHLPFCSFPSWPFSPVWQGNLWRDCRLNQTG